MRQATRSSRVPSPRIAVLGLGTAGAAMVAAARAHPRFELVGVADARVAVLPLDGLGEQCVRATSLEELLAVVGDRGGLDVLHVATPTPLHEAHVRAAVAAGCHVIVEKPVTTSAASARRLAAALAGARQVVLVGHSEAFEPYVQASAAAVAAGAVGEVQAVIALKATDWSARPRASAELDESLGGGLVRRQGVHQIDVVRTVLAGGRLTVREARVRRRRDTGHVVSYLAWLADESGCAVVVAHEASGGLSAGRRSPLVASDEDLLAAKWHRADGLLAAAVTGRPLGLGPGDRERIVVVGATGELVASSQAVQVSGEAGELPIALSSRVDGRTAVLDELLVVLDGGAAVHDLAWGTENLELCEALEARAEDAGRRR